MAFDALIIRDNELRDELFSGKEFPPIDSQLKPSDEIALLLKYIKEGYSPELTQDEELVIDWHEQLNSLLEPLSTAPRGDKMLVYRIAASLFNNQLAIDQKGNAFLGIEPSRLDEAPITSQGIERAINRHEKSKMSSVE
ncbi:MAG: hypothetical protein ACXV7J_09820 [Methylomonas sp.]